MCGTTPSSARRELPCALNPHVRKGVNRKILESLSEHGCQWNFLDWVENYRSPDPDIEEDELRMCPLLWCRKAFESKELAVRHVFDCARLSNGWYWCPFHKRPERFLECDKKCEIVPKFSFRNKDYKLDLIDKFFNWVDRKRSEKRLALDKYKHPVYRFELQSGEATQELSSCRLSVPLVELDTRNPVPEHELQMIDECIHPQKYNHYFAPTDTLIERGSWSRPCLKSTFDVETSGDMRELLPELWELEYGSDEPTKSTSQQVMPKELEGTISALNSPELEFQTERPVSNRTYSLQSETENGRYSPAPLIIRRNFRSDQSDVRATSMRLRHMRIDSPLSKSFVSPDLTANPSESETETSGSDSLYCSSGPKFVQLETEDSLGISSIYPLNEPWSGLEFDSSAPELFSVSPTRGDTSINFHSPSGNRPAAPFHSSDSSRLALRRSNAVRRYSTAKSDVNNSDTSKTRLVTGSEGQPANRYFSGDDRQVPAECLVRLENPFDPHLEPRQIKVKKVSELIHVVNDEWLQRLTSTPGVWLRCTTVPPSTLLDNGLQTLKQYFSNKAAETFNEVFAFIHLAFAAAYMLHWQDDSYCWDAFFEDALQWQHTISDMHDQAFFLEAMDLWWRYRELRRTSTPPLNSGRRVRAPRSREVLICNSEGTILNRLGKTETFKACIKFLDGKFTFPSTQLLWPQSNRICRL